MSICLVRKGIASLKTGQTIHTYSCIPLTMLSVKGSKLPYDILYMAREQDEWTFHGDSLYTLKYLHRPG